jgi:hypothetical protein
LILRINWYFDYLAQLFSLQINCFFLNWNSHLLTARPTPCRFLIWIPCRFQIKILIKFLINLSCKASRNSLGKCPN